MTKSKRVRVIGRESHLLSVTMMRQEWEQVILAIMAACAESGLRGHEEQSDMFRKLYGKIAEVTDKPDPPKPEPLVLTWD